MKARICTGIVTYNRLELLKGAIDSIRNQSQPTDILVVNNGSTDGTYEYLASQSDLIIIDQDNVGGAGGFHTALKYITEKGYDFAWVMDDDIIASPDTLSSLCDAYEVLNAKGKVGFLCSTVLTPDGDTVNVPVIDTTTNATGYPCWNSDLHYGYVRVRSATFVSVFLSTEIIRSVGLPIKEFFIWGDDTEYTRRISLRFPSFLIGPSRIQHLRNGGKLDLKKIDAPARIEMFRYFVRNNIYNERKYGTTKSSLKIIGYILKDTLGFFLRGDWRKSSVMLRGLWSGLSFNPKIEFPE